MLFHKLSSFVLAFTMLNPTSMLAISNEQSAEEAVASDTVETEGGGTASTSTETLSSSPSEEDTVDTEEAIEDETDTDLSQNQQGEQNQPEGEITSDSTANVDKETAVPKEIKQGKWGEVTYTFDSETGTLTLSGNNKKLGPYDQSPWYKNKEIKGKEIKKIVINDTIIAPSDSSRLFQNDTHSETNSLEGIIGIEKLNTSNVTEMGAMFSNSQVTDLDVSNWDTSNVTDMSSMFSRSKATDLDVSNWDTSNVISMYFMYKDSKITDLDVSNWDTSNVKNMGYMFSGSQVTDLDVSNWDTSNVTKMNDMYKDSKITDLDVSNWDTSNVTDMHFMFKDSKITDLDVSNWDTSNVRGMGRMFQDSMLKTLNLSNWTINPKTDMTDAFTNVPLSRIILGENFRFNKNARLGDPYKETADVTKYWIREEAGKQVYPRYTAEEIMQNYDGSTIPAGEYVGEFQQQPISLEMKFDAPERTRIGDQIDMTVNLTPEKDENKNTDIVTNLKLYKQMLLDSSFEIQKITEEHYNANNEKVSSNNREFDENKELSLGDLQSTNYMKIVFTGVAKNNTTKQDMNYNLKLSYDSSSDQVEKTLSGFYEIESGDLRLNFLEENIQFKSTRLSADANNKVIDRENDNWGFQVFDARGTNPISTENPMALRQDWTVFAKTEGFSDEDNTPLVDGALEVIMKNGENITPITSAESEIVQHSVENEDPITHSQTNINWDKEQGIKLRIVNYKLLEGGTEYKASVDFELRQAP